jgi:hypothetical protein
MKGRRARTGRPTQRSTAGVRQTTGPYPPPKAVTHRDSDREPQEFHPPHKSLDDVLGWHNPVYNAADTRQIHATGHPAGSEYDFIFTLTR